jgi:hypothetical protein
MSLIFKLSTLVGAIAVLALVQTTLSGGQAWAGPCTHEIDRLEASLR